ncbi:hypothetical protein [Nonomuraea sp. NPDC003804]|uniref:hypothetical protein n=1 Tax=Nonomuraea sp. NPDC003804 TaxID=3154547 RepID=UPI0033AE8186
MKIVLAGANGAVGRQLVPLLVEAGHEVVGTSKARALGWTPAWPSWRTGFPALTATA